MNPRMLDVTRGFSVDALRSFGVQLLAPDGTNGDVDQLSFRTNTEPAGAGDKAYGCKLGQKLYLRKRLLSQKKKKREGKLERYL